ncbi:putative bifunctional diguanylate cyclase/phosphodiesterase [Alteromonas gilva]|uniref:EAL domain-containing protein n=1 Tax=Alteromonas gilva TaxID=2987522 RepID=A0ABT5L0X9_9ALTE|nr:EAL domain-containing protein [Alteromonas gilva]MDC8830533.1 EAL domain-containing protein [Alteromonas gilva]
MTITLRQSLFQILFIGVSITATLIVANVWTVTSKTALQQVNSNIKLANTVLEQVLADRREQLLNSARVLTDDFGFKQAVATGDVPTIRSVLQNHGQRIESDFMVLTDLNGDVIESQPQYFDQGDAFPHSLIIEEVLEAGGAEEALIVDGSLYQMIMLPVYAPTPIAIAGIGFLDGDEFLKQIKAIIQADIIVSARQLVDGRPEVLHSSLAHDKALQVLQADQQSFSWFDVTFMRKNTYLTRSVELPETLANQVDITLTVDVSPHFDNFTALQINIISISLLAIAGALITSMIMARRVSQPVSRLVNAANLLAAGDYERSVKTTGRLVEINELSEAFSRMKESIQSREARILMQSRMDMLTGLYNRAYMEEIVQNKITNNVPLQIIGINIRDFRTINDLYGYSNGDNCIVCIAERVKRWNGTAARLSGGELIWFTDTPLTHEQLETFHSILEQPVATQELIMPIKLVFTVVTCPDDARNAQDLFRKMNILLDEAELGTKWLLRFNGEIEQRYLRRLSIITGLKHALHSEQSELSLVYQPKVSLKTLQVTGLEALLRWNSDALGFVPPDEFISIAEQAGFIEQITDWVLTRVVSDLVHLRAQGINIKPAVNLSTQDVQNRPLLEKLISMLSEHQLSASNITLEITESDLVADANLAVENLRYLQDEGFSIAIDDFGTGYSSLAYLKNLPVNAIKIDKSFVLNLTTDKNDQEIVHTILGLATAFNLEVVAEGIEDKQAMSMLARWGCDVAQGYYISRPLTLEALIDWLEITEYYHA